MVYGGHIYLMFFLWIFNYPSDISELSLLRFQNDISLKPLFEVCPNICIVCFLPVGFQFREWTSTMTNDGFITTPKTTATGEDSPPSASARWQSAARHGQFNRKRINSDLGSHVGSHGYYCTRDRSDTSRTEYRPASVVSSIRGDGLPRPIGSARLAEDHSFDPNLLLVPVRSANL